MGKVLHASKSGVFPFCLDFAQSNPYGQYGYIPEQLTLEQAVFLYWVPKTWEVAINVSSDDPLFPFQGTYFFNFSYNVDSEEGIVCNPIFESKNSNGWEGHYFKIFYAELLTSASMKFSNPQATTPYDTLYSPYIDGVFTIYAEGNADFVYIGESIQFAGGQPTGYSTVNIGNFQITIPYAILSQIPGTGSFNYTFTGFDISIAEYWSYGGTWSGGLPA
jgi:hypothetical protein